MPAAAVIPAPIAYITATTLIYAIPAPIAYIKVVAVKKLVVGFLLRTTGPPSG